MFTVGQQVCLWKVIHQPTFLTIVVIRQELVIISEIKTNVPSTEDGKPVRFQSLRAVDSAGSVYEKHWKEWTASRPNEYSHQWSPRDEGETHPHDRYWIPSEAVGVYNDAMRRANEGCKLVDLKGCEILPTGQVSYCARHKRYAHFGFECFLCLADGRRY